MRVRWIAAALLLLGGCVAPWAPSVVVDPRADARVRTTQRQALFLTTARIGDREVGPFVIDTGANALVFDTETARSLGLRASRVRYDRVLGQTAQLTRLAEALQVGPVTLRNTPAVILDLGSPSAALGQRLAGALGAPFFAAAIVEFDYGAGAVSCYAPGSYPLPEAQWRPLIVRDGQPAVVARLDGHAEGEFMLDTGSNGTVTLSTAFVQKHAALEFRDVRPTKHIVVAGERPAFEGTIRSIELGGRRFDAPRVLFHRSEDERDVGVAAPGVPASGHHFDGLIGNGLMRHFVVVFNYPAGKIAFLPARPRRPADRATLPLSRAPFA